MSQTDTRYLNTKQAAAYVGLSICTLNRMRVTGEGPRYAKAGRRVVYDRLDLEAWIDDHKRNFTGQTVST
ncbi:hypothetical protein JCM17960_00130 [Magnetospira thiophila]